jgi:hypothetical protein
MDSDQASDWLPLKDAARALRISEKTARRRVRSGQLQGRQHPSQHGPAGQVWLPSRVDSAATVDGQGSQAVQTPEALELIRLVERQQQTILELTGRVGYLQAELAQTREQLALIPPAEPPEVAPSATPEPEAPPEPAQRAWWRFWE